MKPHVKNLLGIGLVVGLIFSLLLCWVFSWSSYASSMAPDGVATVRDYYDRFGPPISICKIELQGDVYFHLYGQMTPWDPDIPSSPPVYIFDESGRFIDWCYDPGDSTAFQQRWFNGTRIQVDPTNFRQRFAP